MKVQKSKASYFIKIYVTIMLSVIWLNQCMNINEPEPKEPENLIINLKWFSGSFMQTEQEMRTGLTWVLSSLGAELLAGSLDNAITDRGGDVFTIDLSQTGFTENAQEALQVVVTRLKDSPAYKMNNHTELGRFVALTLNSTNHYYRIVEMPTTLAGFRQQYDFEGKKLRIVNSTVSDIPRLIEVAEAERFEEIAYIATEGTGDFLTNSFKAIEFEVFDFLPNGQLRFALYDIKGKLKAVADPQFTRAGKPTKCLWCHETTIQPFFSADPVLDGETFLSESDFLNIRQEQLIFLAEYRSDLKGEVNFYNLQDHAFMENIYIDFMEPSASRIAEEWDMPVDEVRSLLKNFPTHTQEEYGFESVYDRYDIDLIAPNTVIEVPKSAREFSDNEPNFFLE